MRIIFIALIILLKGYSTANAQATIVNPQTDKKLLEQFQDAKLGMLVSWMVCHSPATGDSWAIGNGTSKSTADSITLQWNPIDFDAKKMVESAVSAGCKYMVIISKHHDGFGIWNSKFTDFDLKKIPFKRDILKELSQECHKRNILFGIYYSIADIDYCGWERMPIASAPIPEPKLGTADFIRFNHNQVKELMQSYNPDILWFDGFWLDPIWTPKEGKALYNDIKSIKNNVLVTRLSVTKNKEGKDDFVADGSFGDFYSVEAKTSEAPLYPWEACTSITYPAYGYEPDTKMLTKQELITMFNKTLCGNGNLLLSVGPMRNGMLSDKQMLQYNELTKWIKANKKAVYGTKGGPFKQGTWGGSTYKGNTIYIHLRQSTDVLKINTLKGYKVKTAIDLATGKKLKIKNEDDELIVSLPRFNQEQEIAVIALELDKKYRFVEWIPLHQ